MSDDYSNIKSEADVQSYLDNKYGKEEATPDYSNIKSEADVQSYLDNKYGKEEATQVDPTTVDVSTTSPTDDSNSFTKGLASGWRQTSALIGDALPGLVNSILGDEKGAQTQFKEYQDAIALDTKLNPREVASYRDIEFGKNTMDYVSRALGEGLVSFLPTLTTGGLGGIIGKKGLEYAVKHGTKKYTEKAAQDAIKKGATAGIIAGGFSQNAPETWANLKAEGIDSPTAALVAGALKTSLDVLPQVAILKKIMPQGDKAVEALSDKLLSNIMGQAVTSGWQEGLTEAAQEAIDVGTETFMLENKEIFNVETMDRLIDAGLQGMVAGSFMGGIAGGVQGTQQKSKEGKQKDFDEALVKAEEEALPVQEESLPVQEEIITKTEEDFELQKELVNTEENVAPVSSAFTTDIEEINELETAEAFQQGKDSRFQREAPKDIFVPSGKLNRRLDQNNYVGDLSNQTDSLFREAPANEILGYTDVLATDATKPIYFADTPELALGQQESSSGILAVFEPKGITGKVNLSKPTAEFSYNGGQAEFVSQPMTGYTNGELANNLKAVRLDKEKVDTAILDKTPTRENRDTRNLVNHLEQNFDRTEDDNFVTYQRPVVTPEAILTQELTPVIRSVKMNPETRQKMEKVNARLEKNIKSMAGRDVQFSPVQELQLLKDGKSTPLRGVQTGNLIQVSMEYAGKKDMDETTFHEAWHYLREETGVFSKSEQKILDGSQDKMKAMLLDEYGLDPRDLEALGTPSEIESTAFGLYASKKSKNEPVKAMGMLNRLFDKALNMFKAIANSFKAEGIRDFNQIFDDVIEGRKADEAFYEASDKIREARLQKTLDTLDKKRIQERSALAPSVPKYVKPTVKEAQDGSMRGLASYFTWLGSMPWIASKSKLIAPLINLFNAQQEEVSNNVKILQERLRPIMGEDKIFGKPTEQRGYFNTATAALEQMERTGQDISLDTEGRVTYINKEGKNVRLVKDVSDTVIGLQDVFKDLAGLMETSVRKNLETLGVASNATYPEIDTLVGELKNTQKDNIEMYGKPDELLATRIDNLSDIARSLNSTDMIINSNKPYLPHMWFGKNVLWVWDKKKLNEIKKEFPGIDDKGEALWKKQKFRALVSMETIETGLDRRPDKKQLREAQERIKRKYPEKNGYEYSDFIKPPELTHNDISSSIPEHMLSADLVASLIGSGSGELYDAVMTRLDSKIATKGMAKLFRDREGVDGYSTDWERVMLSYFSNMPRALANLKFSGEINKARKEFESNPNINSFTRKQGLDFINYATSPEQDMTGIRMFNFMAALGFNTSTALMQFVSLPTGTLSLQGQMNGNVLYNAAVLAKSTKDGIALATILTATKDFNKSLRIMNKKGTIKPAEVELLRKAWDNGKLEAALTGDQLGVAFERQGVNKRAYQIGGKLADFAATPISMAETATRMASLLSLYRSQTKDVHTKNGFEAMKNDERFKNSWEHHQQAFNPKEFMAVYGVEEAHAIFGKAGRNKNQRGIMGALILPFMTHPMQIMELMLKQALHRGARGRQAVFTHLAVAVMLSGMYGLPAMELWEELIEAYSRIFKGTELDFQGELRKYMINELGLTPSFTKAAVKGGVRTALDIDAAKRMAVPFYPQNLLIQGIRALSGGEMDSIDRVALGVGGSYISGIGKIMGTQDMTAGEKAVQFAPVAFKNLYEGAIGYGERGAVNWKGKTVVAPENLGVQEKITKAIGFTPDIVATAKEKKTAEIFEKRRGKLGLDAAKNKMANIQVKLIRARRARDKSEEKNLEEEQKKIQRDLIVHMKKNKLPLGINFWKSFNKSVRDKVKQKLRPDRPIRKDKKVNYRNLNKIYDTEGDKN